VKNTWVKRFVAAVLSLVLIFTVCSCASAEPSLIPADLEVGDEIELGMYPQESSNPNEMSPIIWVVSDISDGKAVLKSKYVLDFRPFDSDYSGVGTVDCENSEIRQLLNNEFYNSAFSDEEREIIIQDTHIEVVYAYYLTEDGYYDESGTIEFEDYIYLFDPSIAEQALATPYAVSRAKYYKPDDYANYEGWYPIEYMTSALTLWKLEYDEYATGYWKIDEDGEFIMFDEGFFDYSGLPCPITLDKASGIRPMMTIALDSDN